MIVHLKDGDKLGGYYGKGSYASAFPNEGDLYVSKLFYLDENDKFGDIVPETKGLLIRESEYRYIELFYPTTEE